MSPALPKIKEESRKSKYCYEVLYLCVWCLNCSDPWYGKHSFFFLLGFQCLTSSSLLISIELCVKNAEMCEFWTTRYGSKHQNLPCGTLWGSKPSWWKTKRVLEQCFPDFPGRDPIREMYWTFCPGSKTVKTADLQAHNVCLFHYFLLLILQLMEPF